MSPIGFVILITGETPRNASQQQSAITSQLECLLAGMPDAIRSATCLRLEVGFVQYECKCPSDSGTQAPGQEQPSAEASATEPSKTAGPLSMRCLCVYGCELAPAVGWVCATLAAALPHLQHLSLHDYCRDVSLSAFGAVCPELNHLSIETDAPCGTPVSILEGITLAMPNLSHFTVFTSSAGDRLSLQAYVDESFHMLRNCSHLKTLELDFAKSRGDCGSGHRFAPTYLSCSPQAWTDLPSSVEELWCNVNLHELGGAQPFLRRVRVTRSKERFSCAQSCSTCPSMPFELIL